MARYYGEIQGSRGEASRMGTVASGFHGHIRGWHVGAAVDMYPEGNDDRAAIYATNGSGGYEREAIGSVRNVAGTLVLTPSAWTIAQVKRYEREQKNEARREARRLAKLAEDERAALNYCEGVYMDGCADDVTGDVDGPEGHYYRVGSMIVRTDSQGFNYLTSYENEAQAREAWQGIEEAIAADELTCPECGSTNVTPAHGHHLAKCDSCHTAFDTMSDDDEGDI